MAVYVATPTGLVPTTACSPSCSAIAISPSAVCNNSILFHLDTSRISCLQNSIHVMGTQGERTKTQLMQVAPGEQMIQVGGSTELQVVLMDGNYKIILDTISLADGTALDPATGVPLTSVQQPHAVVTNNRLATGTTLTGTHSSCSSCSQQVLQTNVMQCGCPATTGTTRLRRVSYCVHLVTSFQPETECVTHRTATTSIPTACPSMMQTVAAACPQPSVVTCPSVTTQTVVPSVCSASAVPAISSTTGNNCSGGMQQQFSGGGTVYTTSGQDVSQDYGQYVARWMRQHNMLGKSKHRRR